MLIILSGQYINAEMTLHFGHLPPAFLPLGSKRLFEWQLALGAGARCLMTLPEGFVIPPADRARLAAANVTLLALPQTLSLPKAIHEVLKHVPKDTPVQVIYGDTLVEFDGNDDSDSADLAAFQTTTVDYPWAFAQEVDGKVQFRDGAPSVRDARQILCGYFRLSDPALLRDIFASAGLTEGLTNYAAQRPLKLVKAATWYDFGHLTLYYQSRRKLLTARHFNAVQSDGYVLTKTSGQTDKMRAEAQWYEDLPQPLLLHTPRYLGQIANGYQLEYLYTPVIGDLYVFGMLPETSWQLILSKCLALLEKFHALRPAPDAPESKAAFARSFYADIFVEKTRARFAQFCEDSDIDPNNRITLNGQALPPLHQVVTDLLAEIPPSRPDDIRFWHGDFFFGNLFFDFQSQRALVIDPRGQLQNGQFSQFGDRRYDIGKLAHSILGRYDTTLANRSHLTQHAPLDWAFSLEDSPFAEALAAEFIRQMHQDFGLKPRQVHALAAIMFFAMLPMHAEDPDRQMRLLASGLRLYLVMQGLDA